MGFSGAKANRPVAHNRLLPGSLKHVGEEQSLQNYTPQATGKMSDACHVLLCVLNADREVLYCLAIYFRCQLQSTALLLKWRKEPTKLLEDVIF